MTNIFYLLAPKFRNVLPKLAYLPQAFGLVWTAARYWTIAWAVLLVVLGVLPAALIYLSSAAVNSLVPVLGAGTNSTKLLSSLTLIALLVGIWLLMGILSNLNVWVRTMQAELTQDYISHLIHTQAIALDLAFFESPDYYDHLHRAQLEARTQPISLLENMGELLKNSITLLSMAVVLLSFGPLLPLGILASTLPPFYVLLKFNRRQNEWRLRNTSAQRYINYYDTLLTSRESAAELRLFALGSHFQTAYQKIRQRLRRERNQLIRDRGLAQLAASAISMLIIGVAISWIVWEMARGKLNLGNLALLAQALFLSQRLLYVLLSNVSKIYNNILFLHDLFELLALKPQVINTPLPIPAPPALQTEIAFQQVTFRYPGSQQMALNRFTLTIPAGQIVAIVGENGAGKSTLIKLLCRFYDPESGCITLDGIDLRELPIEGLHRLITVIFQYPVHYHDTAANNIALSDLVSAPTTAEVKAAAQSAGADIPIKRLPQGYDTLLGKWFGGAELSGGEWQRVALARAFLRQASIIILDEPTSAMDSWAEADWLARFRQLCAGRTAIIITHRFTTAMQADIIHVMANGQVVESGTHKELLAKGSRYAQSWQTQMRESRALK